MAFQPIKYEFPDFNTFFEYFGILIQNQNSNDAENLADNWLIEKHLGINIDDHTMRQVMQLTTELKAYKQAGQSVSKMETFEYDDMVFSFVDQPGSFFRTIKREIRSDPKKGFQRAINTCYLCNDKPIAESLDKLNFTHAGVIVSNFSSFF